MQNLKPYDALGLVELEPGQLIHAPSVRAVVQDDDDVCIHLEGMVVVRVSGADVDEVSAEILAHAERMHEARLEAVAAQHAARAAQGGGGGGPRLVVPTPAIGTE